MYRVILIPTDGSDTANKAVKHALGLAKALNSKVYGIYVVDISAFAGLPEEIVWDSMKNLLRDESKRALGYIEEHAKKEGVEFEALVKEGVPAEEIVKAASEIKADLIVMGTSGRTGIDKFLLGSVAEKVIRTAPCPVMVVRG